MARFLTVTDWCTADWVKKDVMSLNGDWTRDRVRERKLRKSGKRFVKEREKWVGCKMVERPCK